MVGAGIAGLSAAIESARLGRSVVLVDVLPVLGGQMVNSLIGLFCGVFGNAPEHHRLTHGLFVDIFAELGATGDLYYNRGHTTTVGYDDVRLGRWVEEAVVAAGIEVVTGAALTEVQRDDDQIVAARFATRFGTVAVSATGFVDASGDAALDPVAVIATGDYLRLDADRGCVEVWPAAARCPTVLDDSREVPELT